MSRTVRIALIALLIAIPVIVAIVAVASSGRDPIRIGVNGWPPCEVWYAAEAAGFLDDLDVELVRFSSWGDNMRSLYDGKTDITHATWFNAAYFAGKGEPARVIQVLDTVEGGDGLVLHETIDPAANLAGARIAVEVATDEYFLLELALEDFGLSVEAVEVVALTAVEGYEAFVAGSVDGVFTYNPYMTQAAAEGNGRIVWTTEQRPGYMVDVLVAREEIIRSRASELDALVRAWHATLAWIEANPETASAIMGANEGMSAGDFRAFYGDFTFFSAADNAIMLTEEHAGERIGLMLSFLRERELTTFPGTAGDIYTDRFVVARR